MATAIQMKILINVGFDHSKSYLSLRKNYVGFT